MKDCKPIPTDHPHETLIAAYAIGKCSLEVQTKIDEHCFTCDGCRTRLSILLRLSSLEDNEIERRELEKLFPLGKETIAQARQPLGFISDKSVKNDVPQSNSLERPANQFLSGSFFLSLLKQGNARGVRLATMSLFVVAISCISFYWYVKANSPVQNSLLAMRRSFQSSRPLEARLSGGLDYRPFARTRGNLENSEINRDQINYALAELTGVVASNPTPQERHALGRLYLFLGEFDKAEFQMKMALEHLKHDAKLHTDIAALYYERSNYADADPESLLSLAVEHYKLAIDIEPVFAEAWFNRALCYEKLFLFVKAKQDWLQYLKLDPLSKWAEEARERLKSLETRAAGRSSNTKEDIIALLEKAANSNDDETLRLIVAQNASTVIQFSNNNLLEQYLVEALNGNNQRAEFLLARLNKIGHLVAENNGDRFIADLADLAARASPQMKNRMLSVHLTLRQADKEFSRSSHDAAFKLYKSAYLAAKRIGDELHSEIAASNLVRYSHLRANSAPLISLGIRLILQAERLGYRHLQAQTHAALANGYLASQQVALALENGLRAAVIAKEIGDKDTAINGLILAGAGYTRSGNYKQGINKSFEILSVLKDYPVSQFRRFQICQLLWEPLFRSGNYNLAINYQQESLHLATSLDNQPSIAGAMGRMGLNLWKLKRSDEAVNYLKTAITKCNSINDKTLRQLLQAELYTTLGDVSLGLGKAEESLASYDLALRAIKLSNNSIYLSAIYQGTASAYLAQNKIPEAEQEMQRSISLLEKGRQQIVDVNAKNLFIARSQNVYLAMIDLQFHFKHDYNAAFNYAEIARNRDILDILTQTITSKATTNQTSSRPLKLKEVQSGIARNAQVLSYAMTEKGLIIWYVSPIAFYSTSVDISPGNLKFIINDYIAKIHTRQNIEAIIAESSELYRYLILPVANQLNSTSPLYIIQDGILGQLPFSTLYSQETRRYLIEDYSIVTNHSMSVLVQTNALAAIKSDNANETFIGISNPRFSYRRFPGLPTLPSSEEEVIRASSLYQQSKLFSREKALESSTVSQIQNYNIVHIASHTIDSKDTPLTSAILLAEENQLAIKEKPWAGITFDGILQASEIHHLKLPITKLVILSSCRSGVGDYANGEAMGALAKAFFSAKVPSVIASLWDIDDSSSAELMYFFHHYHRNQSLGYAASLRQAQCSLIKGNNKNKRHPYYWGAFQLSGSDIGSASISN